ncbi:MAG: S41 family peptidase [Anaerolineales bacterium]
MLRYPRVPLQVLAVLALTTLACAAITGAPEATWTPLPIIRLPSDTPRAVANATSTKPPTIAPRASSTTTAPTTVAASATTTPTTRPTSTRSATPTPTAIIAATPTVDAKIGPYQIKGSFQVTNGFVIDTYMVEHAVALVDLRGFVLRDPQWPITIDSQALGYMEVNLADLSGTFDLNLPLRPEGAYNDVDNDGQPDSGVQTFAVAYWPNLAGGAFSEGDDPSFGWPTYLASIITDSGNDDEVTGGKLVIWAPDARQQFPTSFGVDGLLFTKDDPVGSVPAGYSVVDLDQQPFTLSQAVTPEVELFEPQDIAVKDFSDQSYSEAFDSLYDTLSTQWAFNNVAGKQVDWETLYNTIKPRVDEAEADNDPEAYYLALLDFTYGIPDGHMGLSGGQYESELFQSIVSSGYGFAIREIEDGSFAVVYVTADGPAEAAGIEVGATVTQFNGQTIEKALATVTPFGGPFSSDFYRRYQQARYLLRAPVDTEASITFINPDTSIAKTVKIKAIEETDSFRFTSFFNGYVSPELPITYRLLDSGIGFVSIDSYYDDLNLIIRLFERALKSFQTNGVTALIIDLRFNSGGNPLGLAGFLYDQEIPLGFDESYSQQSDKFERDRVQDRVLPNKTQYEFDAIAVLVGPACASACESEAYSFSQVPGAIVVGFYPSAGIYANVAGGQVELPDGFSLQFSSERTVNTDGSLFLEGNGVKPTVQVPLTLENFLAEEDVVLQAAEEALLK